ncbi:MAG: zinc-binding alcohol dehydrogenase [Pseudomonadota bacterium]
MTSSALWCVAPEKSEIRPGELGRGTPVKTRFSAISRGTERLVSMGRVPEDQYDIMRAPYQEGAFPFPVKYGYAAVGVVEDGPLAETAVFALVPHQTRFAIPQEHLHPLPQDVPPERAILAANMETALNVIWDGGVSAGDRVAVIGAGVVGALAGYLAARLPGADATLVDVSPARASLARALGCDFCSPETAPEACDVVIHASATSDGLATALRCAGAEARIVEASWYGAGDVAAPLGAAFHSQRLQLISSQVGALPPGRRPRWSHKRRLTKALELLKDPVLDTLISGETGFRDLPKTYAEILASPDTLCHRIVY